MLSMKKLITGLPSTNNSAPYTPNGLLEPLSLSAICKAKLVLRKPVFNTGSVVVYPFAVFFIGNSFGVCSYTLLPRSYIARRVIDGGTLSVRGNPNSKGFRQRVVLVSLISKCRCGPC